MLFLLDPDRDRGLGRREGRGALVGGVGVGGVVLSGDLGMGEFFFKKIEL
jgi:hypothetical protein